jgi:hypothetical protein
MRASRFSRIFACLCALVFLLAALSAGADGQNASGKFEEYCDGFGFFLAKIDGAPVPGKLFLFLYTGFPGVTYMPKKQWKDVYVYHDGCIADGKCEILAHGKIWVDDEVTQETTRVFGRYEIELKEQHLSGRFAAKRHEYKRPPRLCM